VRAFFTEADLDTIARAIADAETATSAEIRVHLERRVRHPGDPARGDALGRARDVFAQLGMHRTALRHGVLIYLALADRQVAIVGDEGIHTHVGDQYWAGIRDRMVERLRRGEPRAAVAEAVRDLGRSLARHFPRRPGDSNELSDDVTVEP